MANESSSCDHTIEEEEYIDMDMSSTAYLCCRMSSPNNSEFEFHLSANPSFIETSSSADELFYEGKLLPLHLPCRLQMVEKPFDDFETMNSCKTLSSIATERGKSCYGSCELIPEGYFHECGVKSDKNKSWRKRLRIFRQSLLKAPKACFMSMFNKTRCSEEPKMANQEGNSNNSAVMKRNMDREELAYDCSQGKALSSVPTSHLPNQTSSATSLSFTSSSSFQSKKSLPQMLKKSSSMNLEMENSILGAIAYCKMSQQVYSRKSV